jgi:hypothetical protein
MGLDNAWCSEATLVLETRSGSVWALTIGKYAASATCRNGSMAGKVGQAQLRGLDKSLIAQWDVATGRAASVTDADLAQATEMARQAYVGEPFFVRTHSGSWKTTAVVDARWM